MSRLSRNQVEAELALFEPEPEDFEPEYDYDDTYDWYDDYAEPLDWLDPFMEVLDMATMQDLRYLIDNVSRKVNRTRAFCEVFLAVKREQDPGTRWRLIRDAGMAEKTLAKGLTTRDMALFMEGMLAGLEARDCPVSMDERITESDKRGEF